MLIGSPGNAGGTIRECDRLVPLASWVWLLAVRHRCQHTNEQSEIHRSLRCRRRAPHQLLSSPIAILMVHRIDRPQPHGICWARRHWRVSHLPRGLYTTQCIVIRVSEHPSQQDRGFRCSRKSILFVGRADFQVQLGHGASWLAMEQVLGQHT